MTDPERAREIQSSWPAARKGLALLAWIWAFLSAVSIGIQLWSTRLITGVSAGSQDAAEVLARVAYVNLLYQGGYIVVAALLCAGGLAVTRAPLESGAVRPALVATMGFGAVAVLAFVLLRTDLAGLGHDLPEVRTTLAAFSAARLIALLGLVTALARLLRHLKPEPPPALLAGAYALVLLDAGFVLYRVVTGAPSTFQSENPWLYRAVVVAVQAGAAVLLVTLLLRARRAIAAHEASETFADEPKKRRKQRRKQRQPPAREPHARVEAADDEAEETDAVGPVYRLPAAGLLWLGAAALPIWDALEQGSALTPFARDAERVSNLVLALPVVLLLIALWLHQTLERFPYAARAIFAAGALIGVSYALVSAQSVAEKRSHELDAWPTCETGMTPTGAPPRFSTRNVDGPHMVDGTPCVESIELREQHALEHPEGDVRDGIIQIWLRFREDRWRFFAGTLLSLLAIALSGRLVFRAAPGGGKDPDPASTRNHA